MSSPCATMSPSTPLQPLRWLRHRLHRGRPGAAQPGAGRARTLAEAVRETCERLGDEVLTVSIEPGRVAGPTTVTSGHRHRPLRAGRGLASLRQHRRRRHE